MRFPKISVITVVYNRRETIVKSIESTLSQDYDNLEFIVIDGASTDGTTEIIQRYSNRIDIFISEPDSGISNAMNKGWSLATGDYVVFLHSDDYFPAPNSLSQIAPKLNKKDTLYAFSIIRSFQDGSFVYARSRSSRFWMNFKDGILHQGVLCPRHFYERFGGFDEQFRIAMDYDFFLRLVRANVKFEFGNEVLSVMTDLGVSSRTDWCSLKTRFSEEHKVHTKNCSNMLWHIVYVLWWALYIPYRRIRSL